MKKLGKTGKLIVTIMAFLLVLGGCAKDQEASATADGQEKNDETETENTGEQVLNIGSLDGSPATAIAIAEGLFDNIGIEYNILYFDSGRDINTAFASGSIDVATFGSSPISLGISSDLGYEVVFLNAVIGKGESLVVKNDSGINDIKDLEGRTIATPYASTAHYSLLNALKAEGVAEADVNILDMQPKDIFAAWERGDIEGAYLWNPILGQLYEEGYSITDSEKLAEQGIVTADMTVADSAYAKENPDVIEKYIQCFLTAYDILQNDAEKAYQDVAKAIGITEEAAEQQMKEFNWLSGETQLDKKYLGTSDTQGLLADTLLDTAKFQVEQKNITSAPDLEVFQKLVNPEYLERIIQK